MSMGVMEIEADLLFADDEEEQQINQTPQPEENVVESENIEGTTIFDIETGPRPWKEIEQFFEAPEHPGDFDSASVKLGNIKDKEKIAGKIAAARDAHMLAVRKYDEGVTEARQKFIDQAALSPVTGRVLAIGYQGRNGVVIDSMVDDEEDCLLSAFWEEYRYSSDAENRRQMIGFNVFGFDLPFMIRRSWLLDVDVPIDVLRENRYWSRTFVDLMVVWGCGAYGDRIKLDKLAAYFGCTRKSGSGADFYKLWGDPATRSQAIEYLKTDLRVTYEVAQKMGVV